MSVRYAHLPLSPFVFLQVSHGSCRVAAPRFRSLSLSRVRAQVDMYILMCTHPHLQTRTVNITHVECRVINLQLIYVKRSCSLNCHTLESFRKLLWMIFVIIPKLPWRTYYKSVPRHLLQHSIQARLYSVVASICLAITKLHLVHTPIWHASGQIEYIVAGAIWTRLAFAALLDCWPAFCAV